MPTVQHPAFENVTQAVADPAEWLEQGWTLLPTIDETPDQPKLRPPRRSSK
jgi:hypothetical protein